MRRTATTVLALAVVAVTAACSGGSSKPSTSGTSGSAGPTYTVGVLTDLTGLAASGNKTVIDGVKAGIASAAKDGVKIDYKVADTQTNPAAVLSAAKKLVQQDHVFAVIGHSALLYGAAPWLTQHNVPVIGVAEDGPEWTTSPNMFSVFGAVHTDKVSTTQGLFFKQQGATTVGAIGYSISPSSSEAAKGAGVSGQAVGLKAGYVNANFPFGSTDVQPVALAMKNKGVDALTTATDPNTAFALITALRNLNADPKVVLLATGYGADLLQAGPGALKAAQNVYFSLTYEPVEMQTAATKAFQAALKSVGVTGEPAYAMYNGYLSIILFSRGIKAAGANPTQASLIKALQGMHSWDAAGLFGGHNIDFNNHTGTGTAASNCQWMTKLSGDKFELVSNADPICGTDTGKTVSASS
jgi:ABC-type branched-subunit amino acid transport system substrate-binding protein